jgi:hypothetical protein
MDHNLVCQRIQAIASIDDAVDGQALLRERTVATHQIGLAAVHCSRAWLNSVPSDGGNDTGAWVNLGLDTLLLFGACFTGDMLVDVEGGKKRADEIVEGDLVWSRDEFDPHGPLMLKRVEEQFVRVSPTLTVRVGGQVLRTTGEHPFWVVNRREWLPARELMAGDLLLKRGGGTVAVDTLEDRGEVETVYNWRIEDYHTYFVSAAEEAESLWAHNAYRKGKKGPKGKGAAAVRRRNRGQKQQARIRCNRDHTQKSQYRGIAAGRLQMSNGGSMI